MTRSRASVLVGAGMIMSASGAHAAEIASFKLEPRQFSYILGDQDPHMEVTPWLRYCVVDPNNRDTFELVFDAATLRPGESGVFLTSSGPLDETFANLLTDGVFHDGLRVQFLSAGFGFRWPDTRFEIDWFQTYEHWIFDPTITHYFVPRLSEVDLHGYAVEGVDFELHYEVSPEEGGPYEVFLINLSGTFSFRGVPIPEPATACLLGIGAIVLGCGGTGPGRESVRQGTHPAITSCEKN